MFAFFTPIFDTNFLHQFFTPIFVTNFWHQNFCFFTPRFLLFYTKILVILHQKFCFFTSQFFLFYTKNSAFLHQIFFFFYTKFFYTKNSAFLHQFLLHQKFCFCCTIFLQKILKFRKANIGVKKVDPLKYVKPAYFLYVYMLFSAFKTYPFLTYKINN